MRNEIKYEVNSKSISYLMTKIEAKELSIPEIQRPYVWENVQVRDLIDSLYKGYPIGYIITWSNDAVGLKDGSSSKNTSIIIDGQQRITALSASLKGREVFDNNYSKRRIKIAFNPISEKFEVLDSAIQKSDEWVEDISIFFADGFDSFDFVIKYAKKTNSDASEISKVISRLTSIPSMLVGLVELPSSLSIEEVTEIFNRINSKGVKLSQADFALSRIAANLEYEGPDLRKSIDYFCHLIARPQDYENITKSDREFCQTDLFKNIKWIESYFSVFMPDYNDLLRIIFGYKFKRGRLRDFVQLLSGRNFEIRTNEQEIVERTFVELKTAILETTNQHNFKSYVNRLENIGLLKNKFIQSKNVINFGYILFLILKEKGIDHDTRNICVERWLILANITKRYSGSSETAFQRDIDMFIKSDNPVKVIDRIEQAELSDNFWEVTLIDQLSTSHTPTFYTFVMAQIVNGDNGFLSTEKVTSIIKNVGDKHHVFPKKYLENNGFKQTEYNQIANYVMINKETNIIIGKKAPIDYLSEFDDNQKNFEENALPVNLETMEANDYSEFLEQRRKLMSKKIREYYERFK